jgi:hypothetical protein
MKMRMLSTLHNIEKNIFGYIRHIIEFNKLVKGETQLNVSAKLLCIVLIISSFSIYMVSVTPVKANIPQVQDVIVWNSGSETILNITVFHTPVTALHHVDEIEVDVGGSITSFPVDQPSTTFVFPANLGQIAGTPSVRARAHDTVHGWSSWSTPLQVPEFPSWILLLLFITATIFAILVKKKTFHPTYNNN